MIPLAEEGTIHINKGQKRISLREGLWVISPNGEVRLIASKCNSCGEVVFPPLRMCPNCQNGNIEEIKVGPRGTVYSVTVIMQQPPVWYKGPIPYALGFVELPDGVRVETLFTDCEPEEIQIGMEAELVVEKLYKDDQGNEVITYKFRPVKN